MTYLDGRSYREVAVELGIPEGTAKSRGRLALAKLAASLAAVGVTTWRLQIITVIPGKNASPTRT